MIDNRKVVISQGGSICCPICGNAMQWCYQMERVHDCSLGMFTSVDAQSSRNMAPIATADGKVRFVGWCTACKESIETDKMELINKENYEKNSKGD